MSNASTNEPMPAKGKLDVKDFVLKDLQDRIEMGEKKYNTTLQTFNGRDALWDAYQEALDLVMYLRQAILERDSV